MYDLFTNEWVKYPEAVPGEFDPETAFPEAYAEARILANEFDIEIGTLRRDIIEANYVLDNLRDPQADRAKLKQKLTETVTKVDQDLQELFDKAHDLKADRRAAFSNNPVEVREGYMVSKNWLPENLKYKWIERWKYLSPIELLKKIWKDDTRNDATKVRQLSRQLKLSVQMPLSTEITKLSAPSLEYPGEPDRKSVV